MSVKRIYVEKKSEFAVEANAVLADLITSLGINNIESIRIINRYDVQGISESDMEKAQSTVFSEPPVDKVYFELPTIEENEFMFAIEYLPGQFDQRADSASQCIQMLVQGERPIVRNARLYIIKGDISEIIFTKIKDYLINPVEAREATLDEFDDLSMKLEDDNRIETLAGFVNIDHKRLGDFINLYGLAMDVDDIAFCQQYFKDTQMRNPTITELKMIDTYWSDHCRHTTFSTIIDDVKFEDSYIQDTYNEYLEAREILYKDRNDKPITLMDLATMGARKLKSEGYLDDLDESEEINACSVNIKVLVDDNEEDWLLQFKNETHNHPTEIEPFGGAATCLGGAIRDPLSGRSYVYQAMRVTGASNPLVPIDKTIEGKLPQKKIVTGAAHGYSSYGNQIGLSTGLVQEIYHDGYVAKRMEVGAVIGAVPKKNVVREEPQPDDVVVLLGGKTGRDGCGGATGSSKSHTLGSLEDCGAEVQKGNPPEERKIQRLFRRGEVTRLIKRCNDFGAGGVSVAIGELADGLLIDLDAIPKKYEGLDGTELAISESQERMACVVALKDLEKFIEYANQENIEATKVAVVTEKKHLVMYWKGERIVDLSREFLNSNGAEKHTTAVIPKVELKLHYDYDVTTSNLIEHIADINICSQKGLIERFDSTIGAGTVLMPLGGEYQMTPTQGMVAKIPVLKGETNTCSVMTFGFNPFISEQSPYHGAMYAVIESVAKVVAVGGSYNQCWLSFQEYFERLKDEPLRWGKPLAALLGAYKAQLELKIGAIGGKDSMSGTFEDIDVPPTLISFAVSMTTGKKAMSQEFKKPNSPIALLLPEYDENGLPNFEQLRRNFSRVERYIEKGLVSACSTITMGGVAEALSKMAFGNSIGIKLSKKLSKEVMFNPVYGGFVLELSPRADVSQFDIIGTTLSKYIFWDSDGDLAADLILLRNQYLSKLEPIYPSQIVHKSKNAKSYRFQYPRHQIAKPSIKMLKPKVLIPVFPGTNCEYDSARAFDKAGGKSEIFVIRNLTSNDIEESINAFTKMIDESQIIMLPGGFSGGDEPDGSAKFITAFFRNPRITEAVHKLLNERDGLMLGICNGFQALIKLGLLPYGEICDIKEDSPTLTFNTIGRHQSSMVNTHISSVKSPWLLRCKLGDIHSIPVSHGEGRFIADKHMIESLEKNGQIATQYVDYAGQASCAVQHNPNESVMAIEGITSLDGRIFGKMGHSERVGDFVSKNVIGEKDQQIFRAGIDYYKE